MSVAGFTDDVLEYIRVSVPKNMLADLKDSVKQGRCLNVQDKYGATAVSLLHTQRNTERPPVYKCLCCSTSIWFMHTAHTMLNRKDLQSKVCSSLSEFGSCLMLSLPLYLSSLTSLSFFSLPSPPSHLPAACGRCQWLHGCPKLHPLPGQHQPGCSGHRGVDPVPRGGVLGAAGGHETTGREGSQHGHQEPSRRDSLWWVHLIVVAHPEVGLD